MHVPKKVRRMLAFTVLATVPTLSCAWADDSVLTLSKAELLATMHNQALAASTKNAEAMAAIPPQVGTLPDPMLSLNALNFPVNSFSATQEAMTQMQVGISQALPFPGKLSLREKAAGFEASAAAYNTKELGLVVVRNARLVWWNLFFLDRAISIVQRNQVLLRQFVKIAETKYKTGQGLQSDVLLAQVELSKLLDVEISLQASRRSQAADMNALLDRPAVAAVVLPALADESLAPIPDAEPLRQWALEARPVLFAKRSKLDAAHMRVDLAEKDYYPDFKLGAAYGLRGGSNPNGSSRADMSSIMLSMSLPIYTSSKQDRAVEQRQAEVARQEFSLEDRVVAVDAEIEKALADYRAGHDQALLFKTGIIPQASQTVSSMLAAYQVNKVDFLNLVRAQITLYNYETQYWKALSAARQSWARLDAAVGKPVPWIKPNEKEGEMMHE
ncbi:MAG: TolC family protein [Mariprofundus sp.]